MTYILQGLLLGLAYVAPIGTQNLFVINNALQGQIPNAIKVALVTVFFDVSLALACFFGLGIIIDRYYWAKEFLLIGGGLAVICIGYKLVTSKVCRLDKNAVGMTTLKLILSSFMVTWFNPQAIIDGSLLLGGYHASLPTESATLFIIGVALASFLWFTNLALITAVFRKVFSEKLLRVINIVCGAIIVFYGFKLVLEFTKTVLIFIPK